MRRLRVMMPDGVGVGDARASLRAVAVVWYIMATVRVGVEDVRRGLLELIDEQVYVITWRIQRLVQIDRSCAPLASKHICKCPQGIPYANTAYHKHPTIYNLSHQQDP